MDHGIAASHPRELNYLEEKGSYSGILSWILSTDHKRIAILYMISMFTFFLVGVGLGFLMRLELIAPGETIMGPRTYNSIYTLHGVIMVFLFIVPGLPAIFGNFVMPIMIGAKDVSFPKINLVSWYCYVAGAICALLGLFLPGEVVDTGWTFYVPYSSKTLANVNLPVFGAWLLGMSSILTGVNFVTTMHRLRAPGMTFFRMPLFCWSLYATGWIQILATPVVGITLLLLIMERFFNIAVFDPSMGGDPIMFQHLFWIYSHPAVYVMILPAMGAVSDILPTFCRKTIFGYRAIAISSVLIAVFGYLVWAHHMFTSGMSDYAKVVFSFLTYTVAIPTAIKVFAWTATLYKASIKMSPPMLMALFFIYNFNIGGLTGMFLGSLGTDIHLHDTYFIVAHFHYTMFGGGAFGMFAAWHYWFPKMWGRMYNQKRAYIATTTMFIGYQFLYMPLFFAGFLGMPRRYFDYLPEFQVYHVISNIGAWVMITGILMMFFNMIEGMMKGEKVGPNPWGGVTLEWQVASPPTQFNFDKIPTVTHGPYDHELFTQEGAKA